MPHGFAGRLRTGQALRDPGAAGILAKAKSGVFGRRAVVTMACTLTWSEPAASSSTSHTPTEPPCRSRRVRMSRSPEGSPGRRRSAVSDSAFLAHCFRLGLQHPDAALDGVAAPEPAARIAPLRSGDSGPAPRREGGEGHGEGLRWMFMTASLPQPPPGLRKTLANDRIVRLLARRPGPLMGGVGAF